LHGFEITNVALLIHTLLFIRLHPNYLINCFQLMTRTTGQTTLQQTTKPKNIKTETSMSEQAPIREEGLSNLIYVHNLVCVPNSSFPIYAEAIP